MKIALGLCGLKPCGWLVAHGENCGEVARIWDFFFQGLHLYSLGLSITEGIFLIISSTWCENEACIITTH